MELGVTEPFSKVESFKLIEFRRGTSLSVCVCVENITNQMWRRSPGSRFLFSLRIFSDAFNILRNTISLFN